MSVVGGPNPVVMVRSRLFKVALGVTVAVILMSAAVGIRAVTAGSSSLLVSFGGRLVYSQLFVLTTVGEMVRNGSVRDPSHTQYSVVIP
jgi:hypothetical protein